MIPGRSDYSLGSAFRLRCAFLWVKRTSCSRGTGEQREHFQRASGATLQLAKLDPERLCARLSEAPGPEPLPLVARLLAGPRGPGASGGTRAVRGRRRSGPGEHRGARAAAGAAPGEEQGPARPRRDPRAAGGGRAAPGRGGAAGGAGPARRGGKEGREGRKRSGAERSGGSGLRCCPFKRASGRRRLVQRQPPPRSPSPRRLGLPRPPRPPPSSAPRAGPGPGPGAGAGPGPGPARAEQPRGRGEAAQARARSRSRR